MLLDNQQEGGFTVEENSLENKLEEIFKDRPGMEFEIYTEDEYMVVQVRVDNGNEKRAKEFAYQNKESFKESQLYGVYLPEVEEGDIVPRIYVDE